jgi:hypothetical protein
VNGTSRDYLSVMLRLVLRGPDRNIATVRYPAGPLAAGDSRRVRAHLAPPGFTVEGADLELIVQGSPRGPLGGGNFLKIEATI